MIGRRERERERDSVCVCVWVCVCAYTREIHTMLIHEKKTRDTYMMHMHCSVSKSHTRMAGVGPP